MAARHAFVAACLGSGAFSIVLLLASLPALLSVNASIHLLPSPQFQSPAQQPPLAADTAIAPFGLNVVYSQIKETGPNRAIVGPTPSILTTRHRQLPGLHKNKQRTSQRGRRAGARSELHLLLVALLTSALLIDFFPKREG